MDFGIISFILGAVAGVVLAAVVARSKFAVLQERLREARYELSQRVDNIRKR